MTKKNNHHYDIIHGDCLDVLREIPTNSIDVTFADPPFNLNKKYGDYRDRQDFHDYLQWCKKWLQEMVRITKTSGSIFVHNIPKWLTYYATFLNDIADFRHWISWDAPSSPMGKSLQPSHYGLLYYAKDRRLNKFHELRYPHKRCRKCDYLSKDYGGKKSKLHPFGPLVSDVWSDIHRIRHNKRRDPHPCQLPIHLLERIILMSSDAGDTILDPFIGTGTTAIAAARLGRRAIGIDIDSQYIDITRAKLSTGIPQTKLGNTWVSLFCKEIITIADCDWQQLEAYFLVPDNIAHIDHVRILPDNRETPDVVLPG